MEVHVIGVIIEFGTFRLHPTAVLVSDHTLVLVLSPESWDQVMIFQEI